MRKAGYKIADLQEKGSSNITHKGDYSREVQVALLDGVDTGGFDVLALARIAARSPSITPDLSVATYLACESRSPAALDGKPVTRPMILVLILVLRSVWMSLHDGVVVTFGSGGGTKFWG